MISSSAHALCWISWSRAIPNNNTSGCRQILPAMQRYPSICGSVKARLTWHKHVPSSPPPRSPWNCAQRSNNHPLSFACREAARQRERARVRVRRHAAAWRRECLARVQPSHARCSSMARCARLHAARNNPLQWCAAPLRGSGFSQPIFVKEARMRTFDTVLPPHPPPSENPRTA